MTTYFKPTKSVAVPYLTNETILEEISNIYPLSTNSFFAIRVDGVFPKITYRIAPPQSHPRETLTEVVERQTVRSFESQKGTIFGFWSPEFTSAFSVAGLHLNFLSEDRKAGGHILQFNAEDAILSAAVIRKYTVQLPETKEFSSEVIVEPDRNIVSKAERM
ncbi:alpha-acetolactate decarboxylase [Aspergillus leporis]|uniref:Alpha-acetolactate decarboxylase n=1 Tax=Aspergillus leporis TaxID=41062 RepID=A0A5N5WIW2_9EURO|nr:alpha-acetolactate decarboxylase [Aspergillus leporis]